MSKYKTIENILSGEDVYHDLYVTYIAKVYVNGNRVDHTLGMEIINERLRDFMSDYENDKTSGRLMVFIKKCCRENTEDTLKGFDWGEVLITNWEIIPFI